MAEHETTVTSSRYRSWCLVIRLKCLIVAYLHLFAVIIDIIAHVVVVAIVTDGFQCDVTYKSFHEVDWYNLEPILLAVNIGTHGFHPLPLTITRRESWNRASPLTCYPGMFHVNMSDVLTFMINILWLYLVKLFVKAVHKKDPEPMLFFTGVNVCKLIIQVLTFGYLNEFRYIHKKDVIRFIKLFDIAVSGLFLAVIYEYIKVIRAERKSVTTISQIDDDEPPSYAECLVTSTPVSEDTRKNDTETVVDTQPGAASEETPIFTI